MDFDDLDDAEVEAGVATAAGGEFEEELLEVLSGTGCPDALKDYLREEGLYTLEKFAAHIGAVEDDDFKKEVDRIAAKLRPPAETTKEQVAIRNAFRRAKHRVKQTSPDAEPAAESAAAPAATATVAAVEEPPAPAAKESPAAAAKEAPVVAAEEAPAAAAEEPQAPAAAESGGATGSPGGLMDDLDAAEEAAAAKASAAAPAAEAPQSRSTWHPDAWDGGQGSDYKSFIQEYLGRLTTGQVNYSAPGVPGREPSWKVDADFETLRNVAMANKEQLAKSGVKPLSPFIKLTMQDLEQKCKKVVNGEMYGLPVPVNLDDFKKRGEKYLTQCLHAAGTLPKDNSVKKITEFKRLPMTGKLAAGGSGPKAFLKIQWAKEDPDLHTDLFCKMPWDMGSGTAKATAGELSPAEQEIFYKNKEKGIDPFYRWKCSATIDYEAQEATIYRFLGPIFPFKIPKYYFADICRENTNYILITEKIAYPKRGEVKEPKPYEILPVAEKYFDFQLQPRMRYEMYYAIMRAQARMAAWDKLGVFEVAPPEMRGAGMAPPFLGMFEWPRKLPAKRRAAMNRGGEQTANLWVEFLTDKAKSLYDKKFSEKRFLDALCDCAKATNAYKDDIFLYTCLFPEYIALQHTNLQSDNAYYWYNDKDEMDTGLIDWGGASPGPFAARLSGSITSALGEVLDEHEEGFLRCFINEYYRECGIWLDYGELHRQWMLNYCCYINSMGSNIEMEIFRETPRPMWKNIKDKWDDKAAGRWNVRCYVFMIDHALEYLYRRWKKNGERRLHCHDIFEEWKDYWEGSGMT